MREKTRPPFSRIGRASRPYRNRRAVLESVESTESAVDRPVQSGARGDVETASALNSG